MKRTRKQDFIQVTKKDGIENGLTKREYFAVKAMQSVLNKSPAGLIPINVLMQDAVKIADALIEALNDPSLD